MIKATDCVPTRDPGVVVTGTGLVVPAGLSVATVWDRWLGGMPAASASRRLDSQGGEELVVAEVPAFDLSRDLRFPKNEKFMSPSVRFALRAAKDAVAAAGLDRGTLDPYRIAVYTGSGQTGLEPSEFFTNLEVAAGGTEEADFANMGGRAARVLDRYFSLRTLSNAGLGLLSMEFGAQGTSNNFVQDDTASAMAIASAMRDLEEGRCDVAIAGGYDSLLTASNYVAYKKAGLLSRSNAYRPFDRERDGLLLGEGAGFVVLERTDDAERRGAPIAGRLLGVDCGVEVGDASASKQSEGALRAVLDEVAIEATDVDAVIAHGIGTPDGDRNEARILGGVLASGVPVTAVKGLTGYIGAATSVVELILALKMAAERLVPPIVRHTCSDEDVSLSIVSGQARRLADHPTVLTLSWSWFGRCAALAIRG